MYEANLSVAQYLIGKGLTPSSQNYRYYFFEEGESLTNALLAMPNWMRNSFADPWS